MNPQPAAESACWFRRSHGSPFFVDAGFARGIIVAFLALATISLSILNRPTTEKSFISAGITVLGFVLKAVGVYLLFTGRSKEWFAANSSRVSSQPRTTPFMLEVM